jgi:DeoR/GlpR family transcriptional regulator of sugar metabolism
LRKHQVMSVHQQVELFDCSHMTIRRHIALLEQKGRVYSVTRGVSIASHQSKAVVELPQKQSMARLAAGLLHNDMTIYLDAGPAPWCRPVKVSSRKQERSSTCRATGMALHPARDCGKSANTSLQKDRIACRRSCNDGIRLT